jgi:hypothetical protein
MAGIPAQLRGELECGADLRHYERWEIGPLPEVPVLPEWPPGERYRSLTTRRHTMAGETTADPTAHRVSTGRDHGWPSSERLRSPGLDHRGAA